MITFFLKSLKTPLKSLVPIAFGLILGILIIGHNPFIINLQTDRHLLYPILDQNAVDLKTENVPINYRDKNSWQILIESVFFESNSDRNLNQILGTTTAKFKIPLSVNPSENKSFWNMPDKASFGGFLVVF